MNEFIITAARGNGKTDFWVHTMALDYVSRKKKKKAFLKLLRSLGYKWSMIENYAKWITLANRVGSKLEYSYIGFLYYIMNDYCCCEGKDLNEVYKQEYFW